MLIALALFCGASALELLLWLSPWRLLRRISASVVVAPLVGSSTALLVLYPSLATGVLALASAYRFCNLLRVVESRINDKYLRRSGMQASVWLIGAQTLVFALWSVAQALHIHAFQIWLTLAVIGLAASMMLLVSTLRHVWTTRPPKIGMRDVPTNELPSLTVAIPARNETDDLEACLTSLVASDYPKLEILVLDDCSQNKRTPEIIREYAHAGVRFLQGNVPDDNWLAKNQAYQQLLDESNGELILFCGVDTRFNPASLRLLVEALLRKRKSMLSVIPKNAVPPALSGRSSTLLQPMRYAWELALPRRLFRRPPVLSTCWLAKRELITSAGGFSAVSRTIVPESYFARVSAVHDGYSFMQSNDQMGVVSNKSLSDQQQTTIRTRYPQVHRRIELVFALTLSELLGVLLPFVFVLAAWPTNLSRVLLMLNTITVFLLTVAYVTVATLTYRAWLVRSLVSLPVAVLFDAVLLNYSMIRYEFFTVEWKGRNVCIPVMRVIDHLPPVE